MTQYTVRAGVDTYLLYGEETTYGSIASSINLHFGIVQSVSPSLKNNLVEVRGWVGTNPAANTDNNPRDVLQLLPGKFEGNISVEFQPQHFKWLKYVLGSTDGAGTAASNAHYPRLATANASEKKQLLTLPSISVATNFNFGGSVDAADKVWQFLGSKVESCTIKAAVGEPVTVSLDLKLGNLAGSTTLTTQVALDTALVYYFIGATIEYPTGTPIPNIIEGFELSITSEFDPLYGCGTGASTRAMKELKEKSRKYQLKLNLTHEGTMFMDDLMGSATAMGLPAEITSISLLLTGDTNHVCTIVCLYSKVNDDTFPMTYPNVVKETPTIFPRLVTVTEQFTA